MVLCLGMGLGLGLVLGLGLDLGLGLGLGSGLGLVILQRVAQFEVSASRPSTLASMVWEGVEW